MSIQKGSTFDCPACDVTAPSASVPYDALGYAVCPVCSHDGAGSRREVTGSELLSRRPRTAPL